MPKLTAELTDLHVRRIKDPGRHAVGGVTGLHLNVTATGAKSWVLRAVVAGKRRDLGLGAYPTVTLAQAREKARALHAQIQGGIDPLAEREATRAAAAAARAARMTFEQCAAKYIDAHQASWKNEKHIGQWRSTLAQYARPTIGALDVSRVELQHVMAVLEPIWQVRNETASRLRGRIEAILDWATVRGYRSGDNPARWRGHLDKLLPKPSKVAKVEHHAALPRKDVGEFMGKLRQQDGMGARALEFTILTACRSGEVRGATWAEIDLTERTWTIPAERMKAGREHTVPLADAALALLKALPKVAGTDVVFPGTKGQPLSDMTLTAVLRRMEVPATVHGFRSTFRDWAGDHTAHERETIEHALAHGLPSAVEAAYRRGTALEKRRRLMADWAAFLARPSAPAEVLEFKRA